MLPSKMQVGLTLAGPPCTSNGNIVVTTARLSQQENCEFNPYRIKTIEPIA